MDLRQGLSELIVGCTRGELDPNALQPAVGSFLLLFRLAGTVRRSSSGLRFLFPFVKLSTKP